jgi:uncharacterized repeat protein (TIGR03843 family)
VPASQRNVPELVEVDEEIGALAGAGPALALDTATAVGVLRDGEIAVVGRIVVSSNNALYCTVRRLCPDPEPDVVVPAVYKPIRGERPLFDFPDGTLGLREVAAFAVSEASGWGIVPPTVLRDGPYGQGMVQLWLEADDSVDRVALVVDRDERLRGMVLFDAVVNNADRKLGHLLPMTDGHLFGVDHGICFHEEPHLRTVLWGWRGKRIAPAELDVLGHLREELLSGTLGNELGELIAPYEIAAIVDRLDELLASRRFPQPDMDRPAIPWPPY